MNLKPEEISKIIKDQIKNYETSLEESETGTIISVGDGIAMVHGLANAMSGELLLFPGDVYGMVLNLEEEAVGAVLMGADGNIREGDEHGGRKDFTFPFREDAACLQTGGML